MKVINEHDIANLTDPQELTEVIEKTMLTYAKGDYIMPDRSHVDIGQNTLLLMPASSGSYFGTKLVSLYPDNPKIGEPVLYGTVILNDGNTGKPLALFNGAKLTAVRTAAVGSAGIKHTSPLNSSSLGLIGAGVQGFHQVLFACKVRPIKKVHVFDAYHPDLNAFVAKIKAELPDVEFCISKDSVDLCRNSEVIITATNATSPVLPDSIEMIKDKHIIAIGSYKPDMIEVPDALFKLVDKVYIDVDMALDESGDLIQPIEKGILSSNNIKLLSDVITGQEKLNIQETTFFKSVGMALFDLFTAKYLLEKSVKTGIGQEVIF